VSRNISGYDLAFNDWQGVLFVSNRNPRSMQAHHRKLGMAKVRDFAFGGREFSFLVFEVRPA